MVQQVDVAVIGAGSAGISAFKEARKYADKVVIFDHGPLGTTCARVGCMPSKVLIQAADLYHQRHLLAKQGIHGGNQLKVCLPEVMQYVRKMRDFFTNGMLRYTENLGDAFIRGSVRFLEPNMLQVNQRVFKCKKVIIATGSMPHVPTAWQNYSDHIITSDNFFEQENFDSYLPVIGAGIIGLELGQALARLGIEIDLFHAKDFLGIITDPVVNQIAIDIFKKEYNLYLNEMADVSLVDDELQVKTDAYSRSAKKILATMGRKPNLNELGLEKAGITIPENKIPAYQLGTMQLDNLPILIAGDANQNRPLLHEAIDEGRIAGFNATHQEMHCFKPRTPLAILFTQPNIALVGQSFNDLQGRDFVIGEIDYSDQGRARIMGVNMGIMRVYADRETGVILGSEMIAPRAEHMAHQLGWAIEKNLTVHEALQMPFYHPVLEEGMRTALRDAARQVSMRPKDEFELVMCDRDHTGLE